MIKVIEPKFNLNWYKLAKDYSDVVMTVNKYFGELPEHKKLLIAINRYFPDLSQDNKNTLAQIICAYEQLPKYCKCNDIW